MQSEKITELLHQYFELGVAEGREGRNHDTEAGDAQRVLSEIEAEIAALSAADPRGYLIHDKDNPDGRYFKQKPSISDDDMSEYEIWIEPLYAAPPAPFVAVKALDDLALPIAGTLFVARGAATARAYQEMVPHGDGYFYLVKIEDVAKALEPFRSAISAQVQDVAGTVEAFDRDHPELYWHIAKGKITAGEPLYGAIITDLRGNELGDGESNVSAIDAFNIAVDDAALPAAPAKQEER